MINPYIGKTWVDRDVEYYNRRTITDTSDPTDVRQIYVSRDEGIITEPGDVFDAATMNALESRINAAFAAIASGMTETLTGDTAPTSQDGKNGDFYVQTETEDNTTTVVGLYAKISGAWYQIETGAAVPDIENVIFPQE